MTTNRNDPLLSELHFDGPFKGQQKAYLTLNEEELSKGFVNPVRYRYRHLKCGTTTTVGLTIAETYARDPKFYGGTFCCTCGKHFNLGPPWNPNFIWTSDNSPVGTYPEETQEYFMEQAKLEAEKHLGEGI